MAAESYYLRDLGTILGTAAVISLVAQRLRSGESWTPVTPGPHVRTADPGIRRAYDKPTRR